MNQTYNSPNDLLSKWEASQPRGTWDWDIFKQMLREAKRFGAFPSKLPEIISTSETFKSLAKAIKDADPMHIEFGSILYINMQDGKLMSGPIQRGTENEVTLKININNPKMLFAGTIHRHPEVNSYPKLIQKPIDKLDFILGVGQMFFSQCNFDGKGDILALLETEELFSAVVYKGWLGFAVKTDRTPNSWNVQRDYANIQQEIMQIASTMNPKDGLAKIRERFGIEFYYTPDFIKQPLVKAFD